MRRFAGHRAGWRMAYWLAAMTLLLAGCGSRVELYRASDVQVANEIEAVLRQRGITVERRALKEGIALAVADGDFSRAVAALREAGLPRQARVRLGDAFGKKGIMPSPLEEKSRYTHALEQEIESAILDIDGVVAARARIVPRERPAPGAEWVPASASLLIKHRREVDLSPLVPGLVQLVKNGVPGLAGEDDRRVAVVLVPEREGWAPAVLTAARAPSGGSPVVWAAVAALFASVGFAGGWYGRQVRQQNGGKGGDERAPA